MIPVWTIMDPDTAQTLPNKLLCHLSWDSGGCFTRKKELDIGLMKAFDCPHTEIGDLLHNAGICKETGDGFSFTRKK